MRIVQRPSPNWNERKHPIDMLVIHYTGMESGEAAEARLCDPFAEVSAHYVVREDGAVVALVAEEKRAWHAGVSVWQGDNDLNSRSIGIEIVNGGHDFPLPGGALPPYPRVQIAAVISLCKAILSRHAIPRHRIVGHSDIAPARKTDPGEHFPWRQLSEHGIGIWPGSVAATTDELLQGRTFQRGDVGAQVARLARLLGEIGYAIEPGAHFDQHLQDVVSAFQRRWRQSLVDGIADAETRDLIATLAASYSLSRAGGSERTS